MARLLREVLPLILVISFLLVGFSSCSRPLPPEERRRPRVPTAPAAAAHRVHEPPHHPGAAKNRRPVAVETAEGGGQSRTRAGADDYGAAPPSMATAAPSRDKDQQVGLVGSGHRSSLRPPVLLRSKLARRFMAGVVEGADSAARPSCRSSDVHISCTPPSEH